MKLRRRSSCLNLLWVSFGGSSPTADSNLEGRTRSSENAGQSKQLITANDLQNLIRGQETHLGANPNFVPKTEHKLQESGIIASRHGKLVLNKLTAGNLLRNEVVIGRTLSVTSLRTQENFRFSDDY